MNSGSWRAVLDPAGFGGAVCPESSHLTRRGRRHTPTGRVKAIYQPDLKAFAATQHREDRT